MIDAYIDVMENLGWNVQKGNGYLDIGFYTDSEEDFSFTVITDEDIVDQIMEYAAGFDIDEHVAMWLEAKMHGDSSVPGARTLVNSAEQIQEKLDELTEKLLSVYRGRKSIADILAALQNENRRNA